MDLGLTGKRAIVAASSAGLGFSAAAALAAEGVRVAIGGRDQARLESAATRLRDMGAEVLAIGGDVSTPDGAACFAEQCLDGLGGVDILVANAGGPPPGTFETTNLEAYEHALALNLLSTVAMCRVTVPAMQTAGWGRIVAITSIGARQPISNLMASSVARAGVTSFIKNLATEVAPHGVTANTIQPGLHQTDRLNHLGARDLGALTREVPCGVLGDPDDFGAIIAFLCSQQARFITGAGIAVDGGASRGLL